MDWIAAANRDAILQQLEGIKGAPLDMGEIIHLGLRVIPAAPTSPQIPGEQRTSSTSPTERTSD